MFRTYKGYVFYHLDEHELNIYINWYIYIDSYESMYFMSHSEKIFRQNTHSLYLNLKLMNPIATFYFSRHTKHSMFIWNSPYDVLVVHTYVLLRRRSSNFTPHEPHASLLYNIHSFSSLPSRHIIRHAIHVPRFATYIPNCHHRLQSLQINCRYKSI